MECSGVLCEASRLSESQSVATPDLLVHQAAILVSGAKEPNIVSSCIITNEFPKIFWFQASARPCCKGSKNEALALTDRTSRVQHLEIQGETSYVDCVGSSHHANHRLASSLLMQFYLPGMLQ